jgi:hypothetical protein
LSVDGNAGRVPRQPHLLILWAALFAARRLQPSTTRRIVPAGALRARFRDAEADMLTRNSPLAFDVVRADQSMLTTVGDASAYFSDLSDEQRDQYYWKVAIVTLGSALKEPRYLAAATLSLQTALMLDLAAHPEPFEIPGHDA